jgi:signal peptidase I
MQLPRERRREPDVTPADSQSAPPQPPRRRRIGPVRIAVTSLILLTLFTVWAFFIGGDLSAQEVISGSMEPTLKIGDRLIVERIDPATPLHRGMIVVADPKPGAGLPYVKRLVGMPGDTIIAVNDEVFVNEVPDIRRLLPLGLWPARFLARWKLGEDEYFVIGDNRGNSTDSVQFGPVTREAIIGRPVWRYFPWDRMGKLTAPQPLDPAIHGKTTAGEG